MYAHLSNPLYSLVDNKRYSIALSVLPRFTASAYPFSIWKRFLNIKREIKEEQFEFEDTKGVIRIRISKKNIQHNCQKKKDERTNNDLQNIHIKLKIE